MPITPLPDPPSRSDAANFAARGDAFLAALPTFQEEANDLEENVNAKETAAATSASQSAASATAAFTSEGNAFLHRQAAAASQSAAEAAALAAGAGAGIPSTTSYERRVLRVTSGVAAWGSARGPALQYTRTDTARNAIAESTSLDASGTWTLGAGTASATRAFPGGPNGLTFFNITNNSLSTSAITQSFTPVLGQQRTASIWWRGNSKPSAGALISAAYRDVSNVTQFALLLFSDPSIIADGKWRRYSVTFTHAGSTVTALPISFCVNTGTNVLQVADPMMNNGATATSYVATGASIAAEACVSISVETSTGATNVILPDSPGADDWVEVVDIGQLAPTNPITVVRSGQPIMGLAEDMTVDIAGVAFRLIFETWKGWVLA